MGDDHERHHRRSIRLKGYDYSQAGAYFITLVTHGGACLFGGVVDGEVRLSDFGLIADECWRLIPEHFPAVELSAYVVMPNHVHGIIILHDRDGRGTPDNHSTGTIYRVRRSNNFKNQLWVLSRQLFVHTRQPSPVVSDAN